MRTSSFSNNQVIELLNSSFVPVHLRNQDFPEDAPATEEKRAKDRIYRQALSQGMGAGSVCVYLVSPDGRPVATAPLNEEVAADPEKLLALMRRVIREHHVQPGPPLVPAVPRSGHARKSDGLVVRIVARYLERKGGALFPATDSRLLGTKAAIGWSGLPSEEWLVLDKTDAARLLPAGKLSVGDVWSPGHLALEKILLRFYPPTENTDLAKNRIAEFSFEARVTQIAGGRVVAGLRGRFRMKHPFYHQDDSNHAEASLTGELAFDSRSGRILSFTLLTENGRYGGDVNGLQSFGAVATTKPIEPP